MSFEGYSSVDSQQLYFSFHTRMTSAYKYGDYVRLASLIVYKINIKPQRYCRLSRLGAFEDRVGACGN